MKTFVFDVMLNERFIHTFRYPFCPGIPLTEKELADFVVSKMPALRNQPFRMIPVKAA